MNNTPPEIADHVERRGTIRESNQKLDIAEDHLSDVLSHLKLQDDKRDLSNQIHSVRTALIVGMTMTWLGLIVAASVMFAHYREHTTMSTDIIVLKLKIEDFEKDHVRLRVERLKELVAHGEDDMQKDEKK